MKVTRGLQEEIAALQSLDRGVPLLLPRRVHVPAAAEDLKHHEYEYELGEPDAHYAHELAFAATVELEAGDVPAAASERGQSAPREEITYARALQRLVSPDLADYASPAIYLIDAIAEELSAEELKQLVRQVGKDLPALHPLHEAKYESEGKVARQRLRERWLSLWTLYTSDLVK